MYNTYRGSDVGYENFTSSINRLPVVSISNPIRVGFLSLPLLVLVLLAPPSTTALASIMISPGIFLQIFP